MLYDQYHLIATTAQDGKFGVSIMFSKNSWRQYDSRNTRYNILQKMLFGNNNKIKAFKQDVLDVLITLLLSNLLILTRKIYLEGL